MKCVTIIPLLLAGGLLGALVLLPVATQAQGSSRPDQNGLQSEIPWSIYLYGSPTSPGPGTDRGLFAFTGKTDNICEDGMLEFAAEHSGDEGPTIFDGEYDSDRAIYRGFLDDLFPPGGFGIQIGTLEVRCTFPDNSLLVADPLTFTRYYYPNNNDEIPVLSFNGQADLTLNANSLNTPHFIIVMHANALPGPLPMGAKAMGVPYSFRASGATVESSGPMLLRLHFQDLPAGEDPLTLRILEWDAAGGVWLDNGNQRLLTLVDPRLTKSVTRFSAYILVRMPRWCDNFSSSIGLDSRDNIDHIPAIGRLKLSSGAITGTAISTPYSPTLAIEAWQSVSYTAHIPAGTGLTVSLLSQAGDILIEDVSPGQSLAGIDSILHPILKLRADMSTQSPGISPELLEWCIEVTPDQAAVYLPLVLKA